MGRWASVLIGADPELIAKQLGLLRELAEADQFPSSYKLHTTIWQELPAIAKNLNNKKLFKRHFDPLLGPLLKVVCRVG